MWFSAERAAGKFPSSVAAIAATCALVILVMIAIPVVTGGQSDSPTYGAMFRPEPPPDKIDASIDKSAAPDPGPVTPGTTMTYTLVYTMSKDHLDATEVYITDTLHADVTFGGVVHQPAGLTGPASTPPYLTWYTPGLAAGVTGTIVFTVTVDTDVVSGTTILNRADITSTAQDDADGSNNHDTASTPVIRPRFWVHLPLVMRRYQSIAVLNGGFETGDTTGWVVTGDSPLPAPRVVSTSPKEGTYHLLLGNPSYCNAPNPGQEGDHASIASQEILVPTDLVTPTLTFWYRVFTYDHLTWKNGSTLGDSFDVRVEGDLALRDNFENFPNSSPGCKVPREDSSWRQPDNPWFEEGSLASLGHLDPSVLDLSEWEGQWVEVRFELWTRVDGYYNTWAYVDDVRVVEGD
jgi:hypothetical protein